MLTTVSSEVDLYAEALWDLSGAAGLRSTWALREDKAREGNLLEKLGRCENSLQLSGLSALVKINSLKP